MAQITRGKVIQVKLDTPVNYAPPKPGSYNGYKLVYEEDGVVKTLAKAMQSLKFTPAIREVLESLQTDDLFTLVQEKNGQYLEVKSIAKGHGEDADFGAAAQAIANTADAGQSAAVASPSRSYTPNPTRSTSTYETPEERKLKQRLIVRQAALNQAIEVANGFGPEIVSSVEEVTALAEKFENWVYRGL